MSTEIPPEVIAEIGALKKELSRCYKKLGWHDPIICDCTTYEAFKVAMGITWYICHKCSLHTWPRGEEVNKQPIQGLECSHTNTALTYILGRRYCLDCGDVLAN